MRLLSYNLYEGAQNTYPGLKAFAADENADILCLQEANGWAQGTTARAADFRQALGFSSGVIGQSNTRFELATFSKLPLRLSEAFSKGFWHAAIHTAFDLDGDQLHVWNVHLNPQDEDKRLTEVKLLSQYAGIGTAARPDELIVITGDYNSLSRADHYDEGLASRLTAQGIEKFGHGSLRYDVTDYLASLGLIDIAAAMQEATPTVPTPANTDMFHADNLRLDYMFVSPAVRERVRSFTVVKDALTQQISDHYPIRMDIDR